ncbi:MAG: (2Fe-2S)-binding protein [Gemmatimonadaceae bacterium]
MSELSPARRVTIVIDGRALDVAEGISVAAALWENGVRAFRRSVGGGARAPLCGMGVCFECRVTIAGMPHRRACLIPVTNGLEISTAEGDA